MAQHYGYPSPSKHQGKKHEPLSLAGNSVGQHIVYAGAAFSAAAAPETNR
jgi:hypothetical protein